MVALDAWAPPSFSAVAALIGNTLCTLNGILRQGRARQILGPNSFKSPPSWRAVRGNGGDGSDGLRITTLFVGSVFCDSDPSERVSGSKGSSDNRCRANTFPEATRNSTSSGILHSNFFSDALLIRDDCGAGKADDWCGGPNTWLVPWLVVFETEDDIGGLGPSCVCGIIGAVFTALACADMGWVPIDKLVLEVGAGGCIAVTPFGDWIGTLE
mmetsp:Transcript_17103/g.37132  ORF Transcript_17103/g.37132 Transcript_17103/m.37132 type:complete len:213 (+) Transcript_17103:1237-1875(+)